MADAIRFRTADAADLYRLTFDPDRDPAFAKVLAQLLGAALPDAHRPTGGANGPLLIWQGPHDLLIIAPGERRAAIEDAVAGRPALFGDAGAGLVAFDLWGEGVAYRLDHDRPGPGLASRVMRLADLRVTALWPGDDEPHVRLYVDRSHADYVRCWLADRWQATDEPDAPHFP